MELLHRQVLALQTQRVLLGMWVGRHWDAWLSPRREAPLSRPLQTAFPFLHREAAEGFSLAAELGLPPGHAVLAGADGTYTRLGGLGSGSTLSTLALHKEEEGGARTSFNNSSCLSMSTYFCEAHQSPFCR